MTVDDEQIQPLREVFERFGTEVSSSHPFATPHIAFPASKVYPVLATASWTMPTDSADSASDCVVVTVLLERDPIARWVISITDSHSMPMAEAFLRANSSGPSVQTVASLALALWRSSVSAVLKELQACSAIQGSA